MLKFPQIETARLYLRPYTLEDLDALHRLWTDPDVRRYLFDNRVISQEQARADIQRSIACFATYGFGEWAVRLKGEASVIGFCGLRCVGDPLEIELLYGLAPAYWGQGLTTEAARAVLRYGFAERGIDRIMANADTPNVASWRILEKVGMVFEKRVCKGALDLVYYAMTRAAFYRDNSY